MAENRAENRARSGGKSAGARAMVAARRWAAAGLRRHGWPLVILSAAMLLAQALLIAHHPPIPGAPDSDEYVAVATNILSQGRFVDPLRTPGYPLFLAMVFLVRGGRDLAAVVVAQMALTVTATYEIYALAVRLTKRPYVASAAALLVGGNLYVLDWEFSIRNETLSFWTLVTLFLVAERLLHGLRPATLAWFGTLLFFAVMVRPFDLLLPAVMAGALALRGVWIGEWRAHMLRLGLVLLGVYGAILGYTQLNRAVTGYAGLSYASNVNLFGKVLEYRLQDLPVSPELAPIQRDAAEYVRERGPGPWSLTGRPWEFARAHGYDRDFYEPVGAYGRYVALHYPQYYVPATLREAAADWLTKPLLYAPVEMTRVSRAFVVVSQAVILLAYLTLPIVLTLLILRLRRERRDAAAFLSLMLVAVAVAVILMAAVGSYDETARLRSPVDWMPIVVATVTGWWVWTEIRARMAGARARRAVSAEK